MKAQSISLRVSNSYLIQSEINDKYFGDENIMFGKFIILGSSDFLYELVL